MKVGELKSKIENQLVESYKKKFIQRKYFYFRRIGLKNKNISKLFSYMMSCQIKEDFQKMSQQIHK